MAYRGGHYDFVIDSSFQPFTMSEMLAPLTLYKEAFEKAEDAYTDLKTKADVFKDLSASLPEDSKARKIYEGYANDLNAQAQDLAKNGLNMGNRRSLTSLKQRYSGEIGRLDRAKAAWDEAKKTRSALEASGKRRLYATNNFTIDDFLDGNTPNMYSVDPDVLYAKGAQRGKAISSRMYNTKEGGSAINGYFRNIMETTGMDPQRLNQWMQTQEFSDMVDMAMIEEGVAGNLTGMDYARAKQSYISGMFDGVVYQEKNNWQRDPDKLDPKERHGMAMDEARLAISKQELGLRQREYADRRRDQINSLLADGYILDKDGNILGWDPKKSLSVQKAAAVKAASSGGSGSGGSKKTTGKYTVLETPVKLSWKGNNPNDTNGEADDDMEVEAVKKDDLATFEGLPKTYDQLPTYVRNKVDAIIGDRGDGNYYTYYYRPFKRGGLWGALNDTEAEVMMVPTKLVTDDDTSEEMSFDSK